MVQLLIHAEREPGLEAAFHFDQQLLVVVAEALEDVGMDEDSQLQLGVLLLAAPQNLGQLALDFHAHGDG